MAKKSDSRFASAGYDPRFIVPSTKKNKVKVDDRFSKQELQNLNVTATGKKAKVDRYGRKLSGDKKSDYDKYYEQEDEEDDESEESGEESSDDDSESDAENSGSDSGVSSDTTAVESIDSDKKSGKKGKKSGKEGKKSGKTAHATSVGGNSTKNAESGSESDESDAHGDAENAQVSKFVDRARGEGLQSDSDSESDDQSESQVEMESDIEVEEEKPPEGEPTAVLAVVNLDWDNVRAVDLMSTFSSFVPQGGNIKSVNIYPSEFGKEQMQREETEGPPKELFRRKNEVSDSDSDDEDLDLSNKDDLEKAARKLYTEDDGEADYDSKALRRYQLQRLRYYYAIVTCDSVATAQNIYNSCDGTEYESTANIFDLRYVPDDMDFDDAAKDSCTKIPASYRPDSTFVTDALQHSKVKLTWDETPKERLTLSSRSFSQKEIDDMDFKAYLASDSEDSDAVSQKDRYQSLLGGRFAKKDDDGDEEDVDMEITFNPGLSEQAPAAAESKPREESTIDAYRRKEKERRQKRAEKWAEKVDKPDTAPEAEKSRKKRGKRAEPVDAGKQAELELLMMDDADQKEHFSMKDIVKAEKNSKRKRKAPEVQDSFTPDLADERFAEVFENHEFAIDPTNSEFKKTNTMKKILKERGERSKREKSSKGSNQKRPADSTLSSLVKKFKGKKA